MEKNKNVVVRPADKGGLKVSFRPLFNKAKTVGS